MMGFLPSPSRIRALEELGLLIAMGFFMALIGAFRTDVLLGPERYVYWLLCLMGGGMIGIAADEVARRWIGSPWQRVLAVSIAIAGPVTLWVMWIGHYVAGVSVDLHRYIGLLWQVPVVTVPVMAIRVLAWQKPRTVVQTKLIVSPPLPDAETAFRLRLSARRRTARLIALEAEDHYVRVHTDAGVELITVRFADALAELARAHGFQTHRSWWVAASAIEAVRWRHGAGDAHLDGDLIVPVSRTFAPALKAAGWF